MKDSAPTKPGFALLHVALFALVLIVSTAHLRNLPDFKDSVREDHSGATAENK